MNEAANFLVQHGGPVLFGVVLAEQMGLPLPVMPWLLAAGALSASGNLNLVGAIGVTVLACMAADSIWFYVAPRSGKRVLSLLCRVSLERDCCVRRSEGFLVRHAAPGLVAAKFLPGLGAVVTPLAAIRGMSYRRFLLFDGAGSLLYGTSYILLGFFFSDQLKELLALLGRLGLGTFTLLLVVITVYLLFKIIKWSSRRREEADSQREADSFQTVSPPPPQVGSPPPHVSGYELGHL